MQKLIVTYFKPPIKIYFQRNKIYLGITTSIFAIIRANLKL